MPEFFLRQVPAALYRLRWTSIIVTLASFLVAALYYWWVVSNPGLLATLGDASQLEQYAKEDFVNYYSNYAEGSFAAQVWTNNAWVCALVLISGAAFVLPAV